MSHLDPERVPYKGKRRGSLGAPPDKAALAAAAAAFDAAPRKSQSSEEKARVASLARERKLKILKLSFDRIDQDGSGSIDAGELQLLFQDMMWPDDEDSVKECLKFLDKDESGKIEWEEFTRWTEYAWHKMSTDAPEISDFGKSPVTRRKSAAGLHGGSRRGSNAHESPMAEISEARSPVNKGQRRGSLGIPLTEEERKVLAASIQASPQKSKSEEQKKADVEAGKARKLEILRASFDEIDEDKSGVIEVAELRNLFEKMMWPSDDGAIEKCLDYLDKDHSHSIEWEEFKKWTDYAWYSITHSASEVSDFGVSPQTRRKSIRSNPDSRRNSLGSLETAIEEEEEENSRHRSREESGGSSPAV